MGKPVKLQHRKSLETQIHGISSKKRAVVPEEVIEKAVLDDLDDIIRLDGDKLEKLATSLARQTNSSGKVQLKKLQTQNVFAAEDEDKEDELLNMFDEVQPLTQNEEFIVQKLQEATTEEDQMANLYLIYKQLGPILKQYKSGPLPKLMKCVPASPLWYQILEQTDYENWSPQCTYQMTRLFVASLPEEQALIFMEQILVPKCLRDILQQKKLNIHYFNALIKSKYRVFAFFKAVVLAAVQTNRSANFIKVVNAVLLKCHFPKAAVVSAMMQLLQFDWNNALFAVLGALLSKQMSLPESLLSQLNDFIAKTSQQTQTLVWHEMVLRFSHNYASTLNGEEQVKLIQSVKQCHHEGGISEEIVRVVRFAGQQGGQGGVEKFSAGQVVI